MSAKIEFDCSKCDKPIDSVRHRCAKKGSNEDLVDYCEKCYTSEMKKNDGKDLPMHRAFGYGEGDKVDSKDFFDFKVDYVLSQGKYAFKIMKCTTAEMANPSELFISNADLDMGYKSESSQCLSNEQLVTLLRILGKKSVNDLQGLVFSTKEKEAAQALKELMLFMPVWRNKTSEGCNPDEVERKQLTRDEFTDRIAAAFAKVQEPDFSDFTTTELYKHFMSLFDMSTFKEDMIMKKWVEELKEKVLRMSDGKVQVQDRIPVEEFKVVLKDVRAMKLKIVSSDGRRMLAQFTPSSNGFMFEK